MRTYLYKAFPFFVFIVVLSCSTDDEVVTPLQPVQVESPIVVQYTLTLTVSEGGIVSDGGTFDEGSSVNITATANEGYRFVGWEGLDSQENSLSITLNQNRTIRAIFEPVVIQYNLTINTSEGGSVSTEGGIFDEGTSITITATPNSGFDFTGWEENDTSSPSLTITLTADITLTPIFSMTASGSSETESITVEDSSSTSLVSDTTEVSDSDTSTLEEFSGPVFWRGSTKSFTKANGANPTLESNQDRLTSRIWITRGNNGGQIYNAAVSNGANKTNSPVGTQWAIGTIDEIYSLNFKNFRAAVTNPKNIVGVNLVVHLTEEDIYLSLKFTSWSGGKQGGFAYERSTPE